MNESTLATIVALISGLFTLLGVSGITSQEVSGFVNVIFGFVSIGSIVWSHLAHKSELGRALGRAN